MPYHHLTSEERYMLSALRKQGFNPAQIARELGRHRRTSAPTAAARAHSAINAAERERWRETARLLEQWRLRVASRSYLLSWAKLVVQWHSR